jgi:hypothetical protein
LLLFARSVIIRNIELQTKIELAKIERAEIDQTKIELAKIERAEIGQTKIELAKIERAEIDQTKIELAKIEQRTKIELAKIELAEINQTKVELAKINAAVLTAGMRSGVAFAGMEQHRAVRQARINLAAELRILPHPLRLPPRPATPLFPMPSMASPLFTQGGRIRGASHLGSLRLLETLTYCIPGM